MYTSSFTVWGPRSTGSTAGWTLEIVVRSNFEGQVPHITLVMAPGRPGRGFPWSGVAPRLCRPVHRPGFLLPSRTPVAFVRERITGMGQRPLMYAQTQEAFAVEVWTMLRMLGISVPMPAFHDFSGPVLLHGTEQPAEEYARQVSAEALRILDAAIPLKT